MRIVGSPRSIDVSGNSSSGLIGVDLDLGFSGVGAREVVADLLLYPMLRIVWKEPVRRCSRERAFAMRS